MFRLWKRAAMLPTFQTRPYQREATHIAISNPTGTVVFAHPVGSGKTGTAIATAEEFRRLGKGNKVLAIVPAGLKDNFANQGVRKFTDSSVRVYNSRKDLMQGPHDATYHVMSYELFKRNPEEAIKLTGADTLILDEVHHLKNSQTSNYKTLKRIRPLVKNVIGMTGSVASTSGIYDVYNLVDALSGGSHDLGTPAEFERRYIKRSGAATAGKRKAAAQIIGFRNTAELAAKMQRYVHYVSPDEVAKQGVMPRKHVDEVDVVMTPEQAKLYKRTMKGSHQILKLLQEKNPNSAAKAFNSLIVARQLVNSPHTLDPNVQLSDAPTQSPKIKKVLDDLERHLANTPDGQVIIFTNLIKGGIDALEEGLKQRGIPYGRFIGKGNVGVNEKTRIQDVYDFNSGKKKVILVSGAGAEGLSFNNATMIQVLDPHWNPERILQSEARGIRLGGLSHRPVANREVIVKRYKAKLPGTNILLWHGKPRPALDDAIYESAWKRHEQNNMVRDLLSKDPDSFRPPIVRWVNRLLHRKRRNKWEIPFDERERNRREYQRRKWLSGKI